MWKKFALATPKDPRERGYKVEPGNWAAQAVAQVTRLGFSNNKNLVNSFCPIRRIQ